MTRIDVVGTMDFPDTGYPDNCFCFFARPSLGGGEVVHGNILRAVSGRVTWICFDTILEETDLSNLNFTGSGIEPKIRSVPSGLSATNYLQSLADEINACIRPLVFGGVSDNFYRLLPYLAPHVIKVDILHAEGLDLSRAIPCAPLLDMRIIVTRALYPVLAKQYAESGFPPALLARLRHIENSTSIPERQKAKSFQGPLKVLFVGRGCREKRVHLVGEIARNVGEILPDVRFDLVGDLDEWVDVDGLWNCKVHGLISDSHRLSEIYDNAHILVSTSLIEGFPLVIAEAMVRGVVPVSTDIGGIHQHVLHNITGCLIPSGLESEIISQFTEKIIELSETREQLERLSTNARARALRQFSPQIFDSAYRHLFTTGSIDDRHVDIALSITFLVYCYNNATQVCDTILSLLTQTSDNWQLLIIDDCSLDERVDELDGHTANPRIRVIRNYRRIGYAASLAKLASWADTDSFCFLEAGRVVSSVLVESLEDSELNADMILVRHAESERNNPDRMAERSNHKIRLASQDTVVLRQRAYDVAGGIDNTLEAIAYPYLLEKIGNSFRVAMLELPVATTDLTPRLPTHAALNAAARSLHRYYTITADGGQSTKAIIFRILYRGFLNMVEIGEHHSAKLFLRLLVKNAPFSYKSCRVLMGWWLYKTIGFPVDIGQVNESTQTTDVNASLPVSFSMDNPRMQYNTGEFDGVSVTCSTGRNSPGHCMFGPDYLVTVKQGMQAIFVVSLETDPANPGPVVTLDVYDNKSDAILTIREFNSVDMSIGVNEYPLPFQAETGQVLETRVFWHGTTDIKIYKVVFQGAD
ncbi:MAG: hypothetical protein DHS20C01_35230 [marine bacterium B5-7]|nr:MAG: hypothetical protein DHS20C01_35230 [marine bacterium B5-7]